MNITLAGATGFIGTALVRRLRERGDAVTVLTRRPEAELPAVFSGVRMVQWDGEHQGEWCAALTGSDAVINLSGESIAGRRWTAERKKRIVDSRIGPTRTLVEALRRMSAPPKVLLNASAIGYYGGVGEGPVSEEANAGTGFLAETCSRWESEALAAGQFGVRVVLPRIGILLGRGGGALPKMLLPFRLFIGGPLGSGRQWFPWVHLDDVTGVVLFALDTPGLSGPVNVVAPEAVTMGEFSRALGSVLRRPSWLPVPEAVLRIILGEMAGLVLEGRQIVPAALQKLEYSFVYPRLSKALQSLLP